ncbi:MAG: thioesterase II family protein [Actinomycetota bacterium]
MPLRRSPAPHLQIICFPHAGGWPSAFHTWVGLLPDGVDLLVGQLPGHGARLYEEPVRSIDVIAQALVERIAPLSDRPYVLVGHSFGSVLAFELTRHLRRRGYALPELVLISARQAPHVRSDPPFVHLMDDATLLAYLEQVEGIPALIRGREELLAPVLRTIRADFQALETYGYASEPSLSIPLIACGADDDPVVSSGSLRLWEAHTNRSFELHLLRGGHFYLYQKANIRRLIAILIKRSSRK